MGLREITGVAPVSSPLAGSLAERLARGAARPVGPHSLVVVRIGFGLVALSSVYRLVANGWVESLYDDPPLRLSYPGFAWVTRPHGAVLDLLVVVLAVTAVLVVLGWRHRAAMVAFVAAFTWLELSEVSTYLNHYWFMTLLGALLVVLPADAALTVSPKRRRATIPVGAVWLVRAQVGVVYLFAGLAKLQGDWLGGMPLRLWLPARADLAVIGPWLAEPWVAVALSWAAAVFDCTIVVWLCWRRTRAAAWLAVVAFHVATWVLFPIGVFGWLMIAVTTIFFAPDWPAALAARFRRPLPVAAPARPASMPAPRRVGRWALAATAVWLVVQVALPLRHLAHPGDHRWTGDGYRFAWNVLLTERAGHVTFVVTDPATGLTWREAPDPRYTALQQHVLAAEPELIRQAAHALASREAAAGRPRLEVRADAVLALNGRPARPLIDPSVDLAATPRGGGLWVLPSP